ncbi:MAG: metal-dependent hydrolase [Candidatus Babeliales bacterium]
MPNYKGHLVGGLCAYGLLLSLLLLYAVCPTPLTLVEWLLATLAGALFPDIDTKSKGQKYFYQLTGILGIVLVISRHYVTASCMLLLALFPLMIRHRGITHSFIAMSLLCAACVLFVHLQVPFHALQITYAVLFFWAGLVSHLILDLGIRRTFALR